MTTQALAPINQRHLEVLSHYNDNELDLVKQTVAKGPKERPATNLELAFFLYTARSRGLNPFAKQIYAIWRKPNQQSDPVMVIQTGIDGFRSIASRTKENGGTVYAGTDQPEFGPDVFSNECTHPEWARVTTFRIVQGVRVPFVGYAEWKEFYQDNNPLWKKMPRNQLAKCAESQSLRRGFPEEYESIEYAEPEEYIEGHSRIIDQPRQASIPAGAPMEEENTDPLLQTCMLHQVDYFKKGRMPQPAHKIEGTTDDWCNRSDRLKAILKGNMEQLGWEQKDLQDFCRSELGKAPSSLSDAELVKVINTLTERIEPAHPTPEQLAELRKSGDDDDAKTDGPEQSSLIP